MDVDDALLVLGLDRATDWPSVRAAYRRRMRTVHPDRAAGDATKARQVNAALAVLEPVYRQRWAERAASPSPSLATASAAAVLDDHELALVAPPDELLHRLVDALSHFGDIESVDLRAGVVEALVLDGAGHLTITLHDAAGTGADMAEFVLASRSGGPLPPIESLVRALAARVRGTP